MTITYLTPLCLAFFAGLTLALFYFQGLWYTVRRIPDLDKPMRTVFLSFTIRLCFVLSGFYLVMGSHPERLVAALCGFVLMREILVRRKIKGCPISPKGAVHGNCGH